MTRNIVLCLLCLTSPALAASEAEECRLQIYAEINAISQDLDAAGTELEQGYRQLTRQEAGLIYLHDIVPMPRRTPDGTIGVVTTHRWYWAYPEDPSTPVSPDLMKQPVEADETRARIARLQAERDRLEAGAPAREAECRDRFTDH